jgi:acyl-CoA synthetase (AMP-forming)/AMP-acid ligase II
VNLSDVISRHAQAQPDAPAVVEPGRTLSYRELDAAISRVASQLRKRGIAAGDVVGLFLRSHALHLVAAYALARIGAVQLSFSPEEPEELRRKLAQRFGAKATLGEGDLQLDAGAPDRGAPSPGGDAGWKIVLTSGTTGTPKAVLQSHAMHLAWCEINQRSIPALPGDRYLAAIPLDFSAGMKQALYVHWGGGAVVLDFSPRSAEAWHAAVERHQATYLSLTPRHLHTLGVTPPPAPWPRVRLVRSGSMAASDELRETVTSRMCPNLILSYGSNDGGFPIAFGNARELAAFPGAVGFPAPGVEIEIADGVIRVRAPGLPERYIDDPEASARSFRDGWYYPGDLGEFCANGALKILGRVDDQINFDGIKIYPAEIEAALLAHPMVAEAVALALPAKAHQHVAVAAVVLRGALPDAELKAYSDARLGARAPSIIAKVAALPRNAAGKVDKQQLAERVRKLLGK